jgi:hypothetical protein
MSANRLIGVSLHAAGAFAAGNLNIPYEKYGFSYACCESLNSKRG